MCSTGLTSCHQNLLGGAGHQKGSNPEGEWGHRPKLQGFPSYWGTVDPTDTTEC